MTSTKDRTWINVHLKTEMHKRLNAWCRRNGLNQQDGLEAMIDICAREVNGLQLVRRPDPPPIVHAPLPRAAPAPAVHAAPPKVAAQPDPVIEFEEEPELPFSNVDPDNQPENFDPDAFYAMQRAKGNADAAGLTIRWCNFLGTIDDDWSPPGD